MPKSARPPDPRTLARAVVDKRVALFAGYIEALVACQLPHDDSDIEGDWEALLVALEADERRSNPEYWASLCEVDVQANLQRVHAQAGYLVGLELGRRLGGAR
jgi:hypothetical protein